MLKLLIGPVLVGLGYAVGCYYGSDVEQIVHKSPAATMDAMEQALASMRESGTTSFEGGKPLRYQIKVDRAGSNGLEVTLYFAGEEGARTNLVFVPVNDGGDTLVRGQVHANRQVLRNALAGTDRARLAYAPDWMLNLTLKPLLHQLADQIEHGEVARIQQVSEGEAEAAGEANLSDDQRSELSQWRQDEATRPAVDPEEAAQDHSAPRAN